MGEEVTSRSQCLSDFGSTEPSPLNRLYGVLCIRNNHLVKKTVQEDTVSYFFYQVHQNNGKSM